MAIILSQPPARGTVFLCTPVAIKRWRLGVIPIVFSLIVQAIFVMSFARWGWVGLSC